MRGVFTLQNGTHRIAYVLASKHYNEYLPVRRTLEYPWFPLDGKKYMESLLFKEEVVLLEERYYTLLESINTKIEGFIDLEFLIDKIKKIISEYGELSVYETINAEKIEYNQLKDSSVRLLKEMLKKGRVIALFSIELKSQQLYYKHFKIHSATTKAIEAFVRKEINVKKWGKIYETVTDSAKFRILINEAKI